MFSLNYSFNRKVDSHLCAGVWNASYVNWRVRVCQVFVSIKDEREKASTILKGPENTKYEGDKAEFVEAIRQALYASKIVSYAQGFMLLREVERSVL